jgi:hypothetical protein
MVKGLGFRDKGLGFRGVLKDNGRPSVGTACASRWDTRAREKLSVCLPWLCYINVHGAALEEESESRSPIC